MPTREEVAYFGPGPAPLETEVLKRGAQNFINYEDSGLSLAEISHRSTTATNILADTKAALVSLLDIPDTYDMLFMHGGGSGEFSAVVYNLVAVWVEKRRRIAEKDFGSDQEAIEKRVREEIRRELRLDYLVTGQWSFKASQEAQKILGILGNDFVNVAVDARQDGHFGTIPPEESWTLSDVNKSAFVYYCDNETVDGVEFPDFPQSLQIDPGEQERIIVADMSSNFLSRPVDVSRYGVIFGGAQKNIGITDITLVIIRKDLLTTRPPLSFLHAVGVPSAPVIMDYPVISKADSLYNTLPIFSIWIAGEVMRCLLATHEDSKLKGQELVSNAKAKLIYDILDTHPETYQVVPQKNVRSRMNICFRVCNGDADGEKRFLQGAEGRLLQGLKGHRSTGGIRFSNYNAVTIDKVQKLAKYLQEFADPHSAYINGSS